MSHHSHLLNNLRSAGWGEAEVRRIRDAVYGPIPPAVAAEGRAEEVEADPLAAAVERGAAMLDAKAPGWAARVDPATLDMMSFTRDVIAQVFSSYAEAEQTLNLDLDPFIVDHGYDLAAEASEELYPRLTDLWRAAVAARTPSPDEPEPIAAVQSRLATLGKWDVDDAAVPLSERHVAWIWGRNDTEARFGATADAAVRALDVECRLRGLYDPAPSPVIPDGEGREPAGEGIKAVKARLAGLGEVLAEMSAPHYCNPWVASVAGGHSFDVVAGYPTEDAAVRGLDAECRRRGRYDSSSPDIPPGEGAASSGEGGPTLADILCLPPEPGSDHAAPRRVRPGAFPNVPHLRESVARRASPASAVGSVPKDIAADFAARLVDFLRSLGIDVREGRE